MYKALYGRNFHIPNFSILDRFDSAIQYLTRILFKKKLTQKFLRTPYSNNYFVGQSLYLFEKKE